LAAPQRLVRLPDEVAAGAPVHLVHCHRRACDVAGIWSDHALQARDYMSVGVHVYRVRIDKLLWFWEPERRVDARTSLRARFGRLIDRRDDDHADDIDEGCPTAMEAVEPQWAFQMLYAVELLCMTAGWIERNDRFSPTRWSYLNELQAKLAVHTNPEPLTPLLSAGSPLPLSFTPALMEPAVGHLTAAAIKEHLGRVPDAEQLALESEEDRDTARQLWLWMQNAVSPHADYEADLVAFTY
jgi:hypothetical protein